MENLVQMRLGNETNLTLAHLEMVAWSSLQVNSDEFTSGPSLDILLNFSLCLCLNNMLLMDPSEQEKQ